MEKRRIDPCMWPIIQWINDQGEFRTLASCCGHGVRPPSIIVLNKTENRVFEWFTGIILPRLYKNGKVRRRFYWRDEEGRYFLPYLHFEREYGIISKNGVNENGKKSEN